MIEYTADRDFAVTEQATILIERMKFIHNTFLQDTRTMDYRNLQIFIAEIETEPYLLLSQILTSLNYHKDPTKGLLVTIQQQYGTSYFLLHGWSQSRGGSNSTDSSATVRRQTRNGYLVVLSILLYHRNRGIKMGRRIKQRYFHRRGQLSRRDR